MRFQGTRQAYPIASMYRLPIPNNELGNASMARLLSHALKAASIGSACSTYFPPDACYFPEVYCAFSLSGRSTSFDYYGTVERLHRTLLDEHFRIQ